MWQRRFGATTGALAAMCIMAAAQCAVVQTVQTDIAPGGGSGAYNPVFPIVAPFTASGPSSTDILNGKLPTASAGNFTLEASTGLVALTNGAVSTFYGNQTAESLHAAYATAGNGGGSGTTVTYTLGGLFNITSIVIYGGWNDAGRDAQHYDLLVSSDGGTNFTPLSTVDINPGVQGTDVTPVSSRVAFTNDAGPNLATNVTTLRLNFLTVENGYTGYTEIDVFGASLSVPGDADRNGVVNLNDFILISDNFLKVPTTPGSQGDVNIDNLVDQKDFREWRIAFGQNATGSNLPIPEPTSAFLGGVGLILGSRVLRRKS